MSLLIVLSVVIMGLGIYSILTLNDMSERLINTSMRLQTVAEIANLAALRDSATKDIVIAADPAEMRAMMDGDFAALETAFQEKIIEYRDLMPAYVDAQVRMRPDRMRQLWEPYSAVTLEVAMTSLGGDNVKAMALFNSRGKESFKTLRTFIDGVVADSERLQGEMRRDTAVLGDRVIWSMVIISMLGIIATGLIANRVVSRISRTLLGIIEDLREGSYQVQAASSQIGNASHSLAEGATSQAASLEETSSSLEQMASMTRQNADNANRTNETTVHNGGLIAEGSIAVKNMSQAMDGINASSAEISKIIKTIEDVAFQTNILALNAAVEAARAGEAGKGFAVVADEVRNLAQRSAQAAQVREGIPAFRTARDRDPAWETRLTSRGNVCC